jgi:hypothetical protein
MLAVAAIAISIAGANTGLWDTLKGRPTSANECIRTYASAAGTDLGVRAGAKYCNDLFGDAPLDSDTRAEHWCVLEGLPATKTELGLQALVRQCRGE